MLDWVSDPEWNWENLPKVVDLLWARDVEHWEHWKQHYYPVPFVNPAAVVINYLAADMGLPQQVDFQVGGATPTCTLTGLEGKCLLSPSHPAEEECLLVSPSQPAEEECLLVSPSEAEPHQFPAIGGDYTLLPPSSPGDYMLLPPSSPGDYTLLPPSSPGDYTLLPPSPAGAEQPELPLPLPPSPAGAEQQELSLPPPPQEAEQQELPLPPPLPPAEGECLLGPLPPAKGECLLGPLPPAVGQCLLGPLPPAQGKCLLGPLPPAEGKCLLVSLPRLPSSPPRGEEQELPLPPSPPGEEVQKLPLPSQEKVPGLDAGIPQQPLHSLLRGAQRKTARPQRLRRGPAPPQPLPQWPTTAPRLVLTPAPPKDASLALPKDASLALPKDASLASPGAACCSASPGAACCSASPGAACCSTSPGAACCSTSRGAACCSTSQQEVLWPESHQGELPATKKGEEVWRPPTPAAVLLPEIGGQETTPQAAFPLPGLPRLEEPDWGLLMSLLTAFPLSAGKLPALPPAAEEWQECATPLSALLLTALRPVGPLKPPVLAQDFVLDFWAFKGGGGR
ncbi:UNVERIFIED_CONTAM: hypothetical protein FKN15_056245 [Acipenser sinensis]